VLELPVNLPHAFLCLHLNHKKHYISVTRWKLASHTTELPTRFDCDALDLAVHDPDCQKHRPLAAIFHSSLLSKRLSSHWIQ
jgi:hypothetical protein